jgi:hypothetical protein
MTSPPPARFGILAWAALALGIVGVVGSPFTAVNLGAAVAAGAGLVLGVIALFGARKILAGLGILVCAAAIVVTVLVNQAPGHTLSEIGETLSVPPVSLGPATTATHILGETGSFGDLDVTVANPRTVQVNGSHQNTKAVAYDVTITNRGSQPSSALLVNLAATSGGGPAEQLFDGAKGFDGQPTSDVAPGQSLRFQVAFAGSSPGDVVVQCMGPGGSKIMFSRHR